jgi:predicted transcriptional regulator
VLSTEKEYELSEDEKVLMNILEDNSPIDLNELKGQTGLSNKKWDKAIKGLTKNKLARVEKPGKLHQEMMKYRKKNKLEISTVILERVAGWIH